MKSLHGIALAFALVPLALSGTSAARAGHSEGDRVRSEIMPLFDAMEATANVHDADAHLAFYARSPHLVFVANGVEIDGWDNLLAQQRTWWPGGKIASADAAHRPYRMAQAPRIDVLSPKLAMITFILDARRVHPDRVMRRPLAISQLWQKLPEGWRIVYAHESFGPERPDR